MLLKTSPCHTYLPSNFFVYIPNCMGVWYAHIPGSSVFPGLGFSCFTYVELDRDFTSFVKSKLTKWIFSASIQWQKYFQHPWEHQRPVGGRGHHWYMSIPAVAIFEASWNLSFRLPDCESHKVITICCKKPWAREVSEFEFGLQKSYCHNLITLFWTY